MNVGEVALLSDGVDHVYLAPLPCLPFPNGRKGQFSPWGGTHPPRAAIAILPPRLAAISTGSSPPPSPALA